VIILSSHASDGVVTKGCTTMVRLRNPQARSIEVLSHREEVRYSWWLVDE
jgi:hypothetical protein